MSAIGRTAGRQPKTGNMRRIHIHMPPDWIKLVDKAAHKKGVSRSYYIATEVIKRARVDAKK